MNPTALDNGGATFDRYTFLIPEPNGRVSVFGSSTNPTNPQGFGQYCFECSEHQAHKMVIGQNGTREIPREDLPEPARRWFDSLVSLIAENEKEQ